MRLLEGVSYVVISIGLVGFGFLYALRCFLNMNCLYFFVTESLHSFNFFIGKNLLWCPTKMASYQYLTIYHTTLTKSVPFFIAISLTKED